MGYISFLSSVYVICWLASVSGVTDSYAFEYKVEGELHVRTFRRGGKMIMDARRDFIVSARDGTWLIQTFHPTGREECGTDGTSTFHVFYSNDPDPKGLHLPGTVWKGAHPFHAFDETKVLWLAFSSSKYLDNSEGQTLYPPWPLEDERLTKACTWRGERYKANPFLPSQIELVAPGYTYADLSLRSRKINLPAPFKDGYVTGEYSVSSDTNFHGLQIPLDFQLKRFIPRVYSTNRAQTPTAERSLLQIYHAKVTKVSVPDQTELVPPLDRTADIYDYRFADPKLYLPGITYTVENNLWPVENDARLLLLFETAKMKAKARVVSRPERRSILLLLLLFTLAAPPAFFFVRKYLAKKFNNTQKTV